MATLSLTQTADAPAQVAIGACPAWCPCRHDQNSSEVLHEHEVPQTWGQSSELGGEVVGLGLSRFDDGAGQGAPAINVHYSRDGTVSDGVVQLPPTSARTFALTILRLADLAES